MPPTSQAARTPAPRVPPLRAAVFSSLIVLNFVFFTWEGLNQRFSPDEMMNLAEHWRRGPWRLFYANFLLWHDFYRPMGGAFYLPIFHFFGLHPLPYHAALLALLLVFVALVYALARALGASAIEAWLAAFLVSYHAGLANLYYETNHIYDVLCALFYCAALVCYIRARSAGRLPRPRETAAFFALFLCALNSKEMAVTLPPMLLAWEWLYGGPLRESPAGRSARRRWAIPAVSAALTGVYLYGRILKGLIHQPGYAVSNPLARFANFQRQQFQDFFFLPNPATGLAIAAIWIAVTYFAWRRPRPLLRFCWLFAVIAPLPLEFLEGRGMAALAVPFIGWAMLAAAAAVSLARGLASDMKDEPGFGRLTEPARFALVLTTVVLAWVAWNQTFRGSVRIGMRAIGQETEHVIGEFQRLHPTARPGSMVVFLNDPFDGWDMSFIAELWFHDRTVAIRLQKKTPLSPQALARADYLFDWRAGKLLQVKP